MGSQWAGGQGVAGQAQRGLTADVVVAGGPAAWAVASRTTGSPAGWRTALSARWSVAAGLVDSRGGPAPARTGRPLHGAQG